MRLKYIILFISLVIAFCFPNRAAIKIDENTVAKIVLNPEKRVVQKPKSRIVIFTSKGGGGHSAVSKGLNEYLRNDYDITIVNIFDEVLAPFDTLRTLTFGKLSGEDFYNFCLQCRWTSITNKFITVGRWGINFRRNTIEWLVAEFFKYEKPDLIISVIPMVNGALLNVAEKLNIPLLIITNDLDTTNYVNGIKAPKYKKFCYTLAFDDPIMWQKIDCAKLKKEQVKIAGFPLRPEFFEKKDKVEIKKDFSLPKDKPIIMLLMGGAGSVANYRYVKRLAKMDQPMHLVVCLGRNERLKRNISKIYLPEHITTTLLGFTDRIADLMAISDLIITKPGPGSICEALVSNLPMIIDQTSGSLWWELLNIEFVKKNGFGEAITSFKDVKKVILKYIENEKHRIKIKQRMNQFKKKSFHDGIKPIIESLLNMR